METNKLKTVIIDDEHLARTLLADYVSKLPQLELTAMCKNGLEAMQFLRENPVDLVLLDIQMPNLTGIELLETLNYQAIKFMERPLVVFTTAYSEYALKAYDLEVFGYLLKPITFPRFLKLMNKVLSCHQHKVVFSERTSEIETPAESTVQAKQNYLSVKAEHKLFKVNYDELVYIEGQREYVTFHTAKRKIMALASLKKLEEELPAEQFIRIHKSYIVSKDYIEIMDGNMLEVGGQQLPVGQSYRAKVLQVFD
ncbi:MAG: response regulator transcription factor [Cytophagales bacterium]|nr:response regulator transcription factor [Cytophagales bacterium]